LGNPVGVHLTAGQVHDLVGSDELLPAIEAKIVLADKAYDADARVIEPLRALASRPSFHPRKSQGGPPLR